MTTTKQYDALNRLTSISSVSLAAPQQGGGGSVVSSSCQYNLASQRTAATNADGSYWAYGYDPLGQVTPGAKHWADNTLVAGEQFRFLETASFDGYDRKIEVLDPNFPLDPLEHEARKCRYQQ